MSGPQSTPALALAAPRGHGSVAGQRADLQFAGKLRRDSWAGADAVQMIVEDAAPAAV